MRTIYIEILALIRDSRANKGKYNELLGRQAKLKHAISRNMRGSDIVSIRMRRIIRKDILSRTLIFVTEIDLFALISMVPSWSAIVFYVEVYSKIASSGKN